jgi:aminobenzoyl-glutamate utilization protein B
LGVSLHTWPVTACGGMSIGDKASLATAKILAGAGHDLMTNPELLAAAKADLVKRRGDTQYVSPLSADKCCFSARTEPCEPSPEALNGGGNGVIHM